MRTFVNALTVMLASVVPAFAAGSDGETGGFLIYLFLGFGAMIIVFQFTPGLVLFLTIVKELFSRAPRKVAKEGADGPPEPGGR